MTTAKTKQKKRRPNKVQNKKRTKGGNGKRADEGGRAPNSTTAARNSTGEEQGELRTA